MTRCRSRARAALLLSSLAFAAAAPACGRQSPSPPAAQAIRLVDLYTPAHLHGPAPGAATPLPKIEWRFDGAAPAGLSGPLAATRGVEGYGITGLAVRNGRLVGTAATSFPVLRLERTTNLENRDQVHALEIRMRTSGDGTLSVLPRGAGPVTVADAAGAFKAAALQASAPVTAGDTLQTYTVTSPAPLSLAALRQVLIRVTDRPGATFEIESIRLILRREHLASVPSGVSWQGLSEIYRESLVGRARQTFAFDLTLPDRPWLDLAIGTIDDQPATFTVRVRPAGGDERVVAARTITTPYRWNVLPIDLGAYAGAKVGLSLSMTGEPGTIGLWGAPAIRSRLPAADAERRAATPQGVILIHADTLRPDHVSAYGGARDTTPFLRRLASQGVRFDNAMAQATWTKVSSASFLTSLYPTTHGVATLTDRLPSTAMTLADVFRGAGYATLSLSSVPFTGQLTNLHKGFEELHESASQTDTQPPYTSKSAREYVDRASDWIDRHRDAPFFVYLHVFDPHPPYEARRPYDAMYADPAKRGEHLKQREALKKTIALPVMAVRGMATREEMLEAGVDPAAYLAYDEDWYDGAIRGLDAEMARLFERLRAAGLDDRTLVVFLSDHGEEFQEHGRMWHGQSVYGELAHVPLVIRWPGGVPAGRTVGQVVELIDVMPTLIELSHIPLPKGMQGQSLVPLLGSGTGSATGWKRRPAITEKQPQQRSAAGEPPPDQTPDVDRWQQFALNDGEWKLVHHTVRPAGRPEFELFDAKRDPLDRRNVAGTHPDVVQRLARVLDGWHQMALASRLTSDVDTAKTMSPEQLRKLKSLGYIK